MRHFKIITFFLCLFSFLTPDCTSVSGMPYNSNDRYVDDIFYDSDEKDFYGIGNSQKKQRQVVEEDDDDDDDDDDEIILPKPNPQKPKEILYSVPQIIARYSPESYPTLSNKRLVKSGMVWSKSSMPSSEIPFRVLELGNTLVLIETFSQSIPGISTNPRSQKIEVDLGRIPLKASFHLGNNEPWYRKIKNGAIIDTDKSKAIAGYTFIIENDTPHTCTARFLGVYYKNENNLYLFPLSGYSKGPTHIIPPPRWNGPIKEISQVYSMGNFFYLEYDSEVIAILCPNTNSRPNDPPEKKWHQIILKAQKKRIQAVRLITDQYVKKRKEEVKHAIQQSKAFGLRFMPGSQKALNAFLSMNVNKHIFFFILYNDNTLDLFDLMTLSPNQQKWSIQLRKNNSVCQIYMQYLETNNGNNKVKKTVISILYNDGTIDSMLSQQPPQQRAPQQPRTQQQNQPGNDLRL